MEPPAGSNPAALHLQPPARGSQQKQKAGASVPLPLGKPQVPPWPHVGTYMYSVLRTTLAHSPHHEGVPPVGQAPPTQPPDSCFTPAPRRGGQPAKWARLRGPLTTLKPKSQAVACRGGGTSCETEGTCASALVVWERRPGAASRKTPEGSATFGAGRLMQLTKSGQALVSITKGRNSCRGGGVTAH